MTPHYNVFPKAVVKVSSIADSTLLPLFMTHFSDLMKMKLTIIVINSDKPNLHIVVTVAEYVYDHDPKRILMLSTHRLLVFLVKD